MNEPPLHIARLVKASEVIELLEPYVSGNKEAKKVIERLRHDISLYPELADRELLVELKGDNLTLSGFSEARN